MEYCERETLRQLINSGELQRCDDRVWRLFREIVEGLEHIHSKASCAYRTKSHTATSLTSYLDFRAVLFRAGVLLLEGD